MAQHYMEPTSAVPLLPGSDCDQHPETKGDQYAAAEDLEPGAEALGHAPRQGQAQIGGGEGAGGDRQRVVQHVLLGQAEAHAHPERIDARDGGDEQDARQAVGACVVALVVGVFAVQGLPDHVQPHGCQQAEGHPVVVVDDQILGEPAEQEAQGGGATFGDGGAEGEGEGPPGGEVAEPHREGRREGVDAQHQREDQQLHAAATAPFDCTQPLRIASVLRLRSSPRADPGLPAWASAGGWWAAVNGLFCASGPPAMASARAGRCIGVAADETLMLVHALPAFLCLKGLWAEAAVQPLG